jgi:hypothetical protein
MWSTIVFSDHLTHKLSRAVYRVGCSAWLAGLRGGSLNALLCQERPERCG